MASCKDCLNLKDCPYRMGEAELISVNETVYENAEDLDKVNDVEALCQLFKDKSNYAEVKHGEWIAVPSSDMSTGKAYKCSKCKKMRYGVRLPPYCQECGAKMDGVNNEHY